MQIRNSLHDAVKGFEKKFTQNWWPWTNKKVEKKQERKKFQQQQNDIIFLTTLAKEKVETVRTVFDTNQCRILGDGHTQSCQFQFKKFYNADKGGTRER